LNLARVVAQQELTCRLQPLATRVAYSQPVREVELTSAGWSAHQFVQWIVQPMVRLAYFAPQAALGRSWNQAAV